MGDKMALYIFNGDSDQFLINSSTLTQALDLFAQALKGIYGNTLKAWSLDSESLISVHWLEEGADHLHRDHFQISLMPENSAICLSSSGINQPSLHQLNQQKNETFLPFAEDSRSQNVRQLINQ